MVAVAGGGGHLTRTRCHLVNTYNNNNNNRTFGMRKTLPTTFTTTTTTTPVERTKNRALYERKSVEADSARVLRKTLAEHKKHPGAGTQASGYDRPTNSPYRHTHTHTHT